MICCCDCFKISCDRAKKLKNPLTIKYLRTNGLAIDCAPIDRYVTAHAGAALCESGEGSAKNSQSIDSKKQPISDSKNIEKKSPKIKT